MRPTLSLVIPAYQEAQRLPPTLQAVAVWAREWGTPVEVVVVVEHSSDGTLEIARAIAGEQAHFPLSWVIVDSTPQRGKGHAVRTGMLRATGEVALFMDADLSVPLGEVGPFMDYFAAHPEVAVLVGNRRHAASRITRRQKWLRRSMGQIFNAVLGRLAMAELRDTQCGFKAFRQAAAQDIFSRQQIDGFAFDVEVLMLAQHLGYRVQDLPVEWINSPDSHVHIVRDSLRMLWDAVQVRRRLPRRRASASS